MANINSLNIEQGFELGSNINSTTYTFLIISPSIPEVMKAISYQPILVSKSKSCR